MFAIGKCNWNEWTNEWINVEDLKFDKNLCLEQKFLIKFIIMKLNKSKSNPHVLNFSNTKII